MALAGRWAERRPLQPKNTEKVASPAYPDGFTSASSFAFQVSLSKVRVRSLTGNGQKWELGRRPPSARRSPAFCRLEVATDRQLSDGAQRVRARGEGEGECRWARLKSRGYGHVVCMRTQWRKSCRRRGHPAPAGADRQVGSPSPRAHHGCR